MVCSLLKERRIIHRRARRVLEFIAPGALMEILGEDMAVKIVVFAAVGIQLAAEKNQRTAAIGRELAGIWWSESERVRAEWGSFRRPRA